MTVLPAQTPVGETAGSSGEAGLVRRLVRRPIAMISLAYLTLVVVCVAAAPAVAPYNPDATDFTDVLAAPSAKHLLGTDSLGRDVLSRVLYGGRPTLLGMLLAVVIALVIGVSAGLAAGYLSGSTDRVLSWASDLGIAFPGFILLLLILSVFPYNIPAVMVATGVLFAPAVFRVTRSAVLAIRRELYLDAAQASGLTRRQIIARHILPRTTGPIVVQATLSAAVILIIVASLGFLGFASRPPAPSWGSLVSDASQVIYQQPWMLITTGSVLALTVLALGLFGDALRDVISERWTGQSGTPRSRRKAAAVPAPAQTRPVDPDSLLSVRGLSVSFGAGDGEVAVLTDVSLDIRPGEAVGLIGESGSGKSVTARAIMGLLPGSGRVTAGQVQFAGRDLTRLSARDLQQIRGGDIGLITQEPMASLDPSFTIGYQLAEAVRQHRRLPRRRAAERVIELLGQVGLREPEHVARSYPHQLSGGMAQRVAIARALAGDPKLLIADEPTTALDVTVQAGILDLLFSLRTDTGMAVLLISHDWGVVAEVCDRAMVMYAGQVVEEASVSELTHEPLHPYTKVLRECDPHVAAGHDLLPAIGGSVPPPGQWPGGCRFHNRCPFATAACADRPVDLRAMTPERASRCIHADQLAAGVRA
jgi:peptide/nickel transport system permease protein